MANITKKITLTEKNDAGPLFDFFWSTDGLTYTSSVDSSNIYLPYVGASTTVVVDSNASIFKLVSKGVCSTEFTSGSSQLTPTPTATPTPTPTPTNPLTASFNYVIGGTPMDVEYIDPYGEIRSFYIPSSGTPRTFVAQQIIRYTGSITQGPKAAEGPYGNFSSSTDFDPNDILNYNVVMDSSNFASYGYYLSSSLSEPSVGSVSSFTFGSGTAIDACAVSGSLIVALQYNSGFFDNTTITTSSCGPTPTPTGVPPTPTPTPTPLMGTFGSHDIVKVSGIQHKSVWNGSSNMFNARNLVTYLTGQSSPATSTPYSLSNVNYKIYDQTNVERASWSNAGAGTAMYYFDGVDAIVRVDGIYISGTYLNGSSSSTDIWQYSKL